ncbi:MAG: pseudouridine synthase [Patescibacteria group bacterium]
MRAIIAHTPVMTSDSYPMRPVRNRARAGAPHTGPSGRAISNGVRINKYIASRGIATRKDADTLIEKGLVTINGRKAVLGDKVQESDKVEVKGARTKYRYFAYHKPSGVITHSPEKGEADIMRSIPLRSVFPIGRLDKRSSGLIILTDDARVTDRLLNPEYAHDKEYRVTTREALPNNFKKVMERGVDIGLPVRGTQTGGYITKPCEIEIRSDNKFSITLTEGKKHQIRRMCDALKTSVENLQRVRVMNIKLGPLKPNEYREIQDAELAQFLKSIGL